MTVNIRKIGYPWIVHGFALAHALVSYGSRVAGIDDTLFLTVLTMALTVIICVKQRLKIEFSAINIILVNILGFALGIGAARFFDTFLDSPELISALSTFLTTEVLGWALVFFGRLYDVSVDDKPVMNDVQIIWLIMAVLLVFFVRLVVNGIMSTPLFRDISFGDVVSIFLSNSVALMVMLFSTILFMLYTHRSSWGKVSGSEKIWWAVSSHVLFFLAVVLLSSILVGYGLPFNFEGEFSPRFFLVIALVSFLFELVIYSLVYIVYYAASAQRLAARERSKANQALVQYMSLKQQVNPHFLFNSLNILDCIVADQKTAEARAYIQKLSGIYRYMLKNENNPVSSLREEIGYVDLYDDLLKVRFPEGLEIHKDIDQDSYSRSVVTFSVQMLVENAVKHNAISSERPLVIKIYTEDSYLTVTNNISPKLSATESTGLGLKYIKNIYKDRSGVPVIIEDDGKEYRVSLPLL